MKLHKIGVFKLSIRETIHRLQSDLDESECDFLIDVLHGEDIDASAKKFDVNSRTVLKKLGAQADRLEQIKIISMPLCHLLKWINSDTEKT